VSKQRTERKHWAAEVKVQGRIKYLGQYHTKEEASAVSNAFVSEMLADDLFGNKIFSLPTNSNQTFPY
jgi:hypothetical protein